MKDDTKKQFYFFIEIWNDLIEKKCWQCGRWLGKEPMSTYFDHLIEKSKRPDLRYVRENIFICCETCHAKKTNGFPGHIHEMAIKNAQNMFGEKEEES